MQGFRRFTAIVACGAVAAPAAASAYGPPGGEIHMSFDSPSPGVTSGLAMRLEYRDSENPEGKSPMIREIRLEAPEGTAFDGDAVPRCEASDEELRLLGEAACPPASRIGSGRIVLITGFGPPADPYVVETIMFNEPGGFVEIVRDKSTRATLAIEHLRVDGNVMTAKISRGPGGPPDGESTVRTVVLNLDPQTGYVTTPRRCQGGHWDYSARYTFDEGVVEPRGTTECTPGASPRARLARRPRRTDARERTRFRFRATKLEDGRRRSLPGATIRFAGRSLTTDRRGRARMTARLRPGLHPAVVTAPAVRPVRRFVRALG